MAIPLDPAIEILDKKRDAVLNEKHELQQGIAVSEHAVLLLNRELASLSLAINTLDGRNGISLTKEEIYGEKE